MSTPALVAYKWDESTKAHPCMNWMEKYTNDFYDKGDFSKSADWYSSDFVYVKADGTTHTGGQKAWEALHSDYGVFTKWKHDVYFLVSTENSEINGWDMIGQAYLCANLVGGPDSDPKVKDSEGEKWEVRIPAAFRFKYVKSKDAVHGGIRLLKTEVMSDTGPVVVKLLKRGVMKPQDLGL